jgi:hypothetical protein
MGLRDAVRGGTHSVVCSVHYTTRALYEVFQRSARHTHTSRAKGIPAPQKNSTRETRQPPCEPTHARRLRRALAPRRLRVGPRLASSREESSGEWGSSCGVWCPIGLRHFRLWSRLVCICLSRYVRGTASLRRGVGARPSPYGRNIYLLRSTYFSFVVVHTRTPRPPRRNS